MEVEGKYVTVERSESLMWNLRKRLRHSSVILFSGGIKVDWWTGIQHLSFTLLVMFLISVGATEVNESPQLGERGSFSFKFHFCKCVNLFKSRRQKSERRLFLFIYWLHHLSLYPVILPDSCWCSQSFTFTGAKCLNASLNEKYCIGISSTIKRLCVWGYHLSLHWGGIFFLLISTWKMHIK